MVAPCVILIRTLQYAVVIIYRRYVAEYILTIYIRSFVISIFIYDKAGYSFRSVDIVYTRGSAKLSQQLSVFVCIVSSRFFISALYCLFRSYSVNIVTERYRVVFVVTYSFELSLLLSYPIIVILSISDL